MADVPAASLVAVDDLSVAGLVHAARAQGRARDGTACAHVPHLPYLRPFPRPHHHCLSLRARSASGLSALGIGVLDHGVLGLSLRAEAHWGVHRAGAALRTEPDLRGAVGRLSLRRRQLALPAVAAGGAATRLLLSRARRASASYRTRRDRDERDTVLRLLCARPLLPRARAADGADRHRHHVHALCRRLRFNDGALLCEYRRQPIR